MFYLGLEELIKKTLYEDIGHGDITTLNLINAEEEATGVFYIKADGVIAGLEIAKAVFNILEPEIKFTSYKKDGDLVVSGDVVAKVAGKTRTLLTGERLALNFMQRLSGIATKTHAMVEKIKHQKAEIVDTRKTTPGLRVLEKYAVNVGGARNHRFGLYDGVMIKDNHIIAAGSIQKAVSLIRGRVSHTIKIEVEVESLAQLQEALEAQADIIMLDNMDIKMMQEAVELVDGRALLEASGGIDEETIIEVAKTGVDFISIGALTHSATALDISFKLE
ncbi:MAG TPA: carboxylating nicotinate-nucleotide diphosphorylase [Syntrophomonadaceae bacterium]|nr:carboxylating nicotinate-nucleotide diphosphorylase [Syntrophomonadaceae bacterium]